MFITHNQTLETTTPANVQGTPFPPQKLASSPKLPYGPPSTYAPPAPYPASTMKTDVHTETQPPYPPTTTTYKTTTTGTSKPTLMCINFIQSWVKLLESWSEIDSNHKSYRCIIKRIYCSVLLKWEFFIQMRAAFYASFLPPKKRGNRERMGASWQLSFEWKILIWIGRYCR